MQQGRASRTASSVAVARALHQLVDDPVVFADPLAVTILRPPEDFQTHYIRNENAGQRSYRAYMSARSRYAEEQLAAAVDRGATQYVILGAGFDTFAYRNPFGASLGVYEVDFPATQNFKRGLLEASGMALPENARFVAADFEQDSLSDALLRVGFQQTEITFFSWLGVACYLNKDRFLETLGDIGAAPPQSGLVLDVMTPRRSLSFADRAIYDATAAAAKSAGEPYRLFLDRADLTDRLSRVGLRETECLDVPALNRRYFSDREDGLRIGANLSRLVTCVR
jgi:methyltransferase (TIGR00027 family)